MWSILLSSASTDPCYMTFPSTIVTFSLLELASACSVLHRATSVASLPVAIVHIYVLVVSVLEFFSCSRLPPLSLAPTSMHLLDPDQLLPVIFFGLLDFVGRRQGGHAEPRSAEHQTGSVLLVVCMSLTSECFIWKRALF